MLVSSNKAESKKGLSNVRDAHNAWIIAGSVRHTHGAREEGEGSAHTSVRPKAATGSHQSRVEEAPANMNERGCLDDPSNDQFPSTTSGTQVSVREKTARAAKTGNQADRATGGNVHHGSLFGNSKSIAYSELLAFEALKRFMLEIRRAPTLGGYVQAATIHTTEGVDEHSVHARAPYTSHGLGIFAEVTDPELLDLLERLAAHSQMYAWYVQITINLGFDPADRLPSGITNLRRVMATIAMFLSSYAPLTHTRSAHEFPPELGGVYELETLGRMHLDLLRLGGGNIDVLLIDILPSFPGRSITLSGGMRDVYLVLGDLSPSAQALLVRTAIGMISEISLLHNNARVAAGLQAMPDWATMGGFARDTAAAYGAGRRRHMLHMEVC